MADSNNANNVPEGTMTAFGSWICIANGSGGCARHPIAPTESETVDNKQDQLADCLGKTRRQFGNHLSWIQRLLGTIRLQLASASQSSPSLSTILRIFDWWPTSTSTAPRLIRAQHSSSSAPGTVLLALLAATTAISPTQQAGGMSVRSQLQHHQRTCQSPR